MKLLDLKQGSEEWLQYRRNKITATDTSIIMGENPFVTPYILWLRKLGLEPEPIVNDAMKRGTDLEEEARKKANQVFETIFEPKVIEHPTDTYLMASLDGISTCGKMIIEIKCMGPKNHFLAMQGSMPSYYYPQLQHQMHVSGMDKIIFFAYSEQNDNHFAVQRDNHYILRMLETQAKFWECMQSLKPPPMSEMEKLEYEFE